MRLLKKVFVISLILIILQTSSLFAIGSKQIRVGLLPPNEIYTTFELNFEGAHVLKVKALSEEGYTFTKGGNYTVKRASGACELSSSSKSSIAEFNLSAYPNAVPVMTKNGLRLMNSETAFNAKSKRWTDSVIENITTGAAYSADKLSFALADSYSVVQSKDNSPFKVNLRPYRGGISFYSGKPNGIFPINDIDIEDYLRGVVPKEMSASWSNEALKAQAVCARTYALASLGRFSDMDYDVAPTVVSQVYGGVDAEEENTDRAILQTAGEEIFHGEDRIQAFFHASNGGYCSASEDIFATPLPYFKPKPDPYTLSVVEPWQKTFSKSELSDFLSSEGVDIGEILYISNAKINPSRRVETVDIVGSKGSHTVKASSLRYNFGLNSVYFIIVDPSKTQSDILKILTGSGLVTNKKNEVFSIHAGGKIKQADSSKIITSKGFVNQSSSSNSAKGLTIEGYGWGHGLGMSQWGAKVMAEKGFTYKEILGFYYEGSQIKK